jgi:hypothetical protein
MERRLARAGTKPKPIPAYPKKPQESGRSIRRDPHIKKFVAVSVAALTLSSDHEGRSSFDAYSG